MLQKTVGIVLHTLKYNDTSNIVDIYTRENGRASFLVSVPRSRKSAVKTVLFQPLSMIEFEADYRPMSNLYRIKEAKSWYPFRTLPYDPYKSSIAMFLAEFLYRALREEAENGPLFCLFGAFYPVAGRMRQKFLQFSFGFSDAFFTFPRSVS